MVQLGCLRQTRTHKEGFPMSIIQQPTLFDIDYLERLYIQEKYREIFSPLDWTNVLGLFQKESRVGPSITVNYEALLRSLMVRIMEKYPHKKR